jgi:hypothetical protein
VLTRDASYKATLDDVVGPVKGQCKLFHLHGEECPDGNACKHNHDHIRSWPYADIEAYVKHQVSKGKMASTGACRRTISSLSSSTSSALVERRLCLAPEVVGGGTSNNNGASK